jgi:hypothetical protein
MRSVLLLEHGGAAVPSGKKKKMRIVRMLFGSLVWTCPTLHNFYLSLLFISCGAGGGGGDERCSSQLHVAVTKTTTHTCSPLYSLNFWVIRPLLVPTIVYGVAYFGHPHFSKPTRTPTKKKKKRQVVFVYF